MAIKSQRRKNITKRKCCANCSMAYKTRFDHNTVIRCKQWEDKIVSKSEHCEKFIPIACSDEIPEE